MSIITFEPAAYFGNGAIDATYQQWVAVVAQQPGRLCRIDVAARQLVRPTVVQVDVLKVAADCFVLWCSHPRTHKSLRARMGCMLGGSAETLVDNANVLAERINSYDSSDQSVAIASRLITWLQGTWLLGESPTVAEQALVDPLLDGKRHALSVQLGMPRIEGLRMANDESTCIAGIGINRIIVGNRIAYGDELDNDAAPLASFRRPAGVFAGPVEFVAGQRIQVVLSRSSAGNANIGRIPMVRELHLSALCE